MSGAQEAEALTPAQSPWEVPFGMSTCELTQTVEGPIFGGDGRVVEFGPRIHLRGVQHIYDDGTVRVVVRPGDRDTYRASGYYMSVESLAGTPAQQFSNVHAALTAASEELLHWPHHRRALSLARIRPAGPR